MEARNVDMFLLTAGKYFREVDLPQIRRILSEADDSKYILLTQIQFKEPIITLLLSLFLGSFGIDRFYVGDLGLGILKLLTAGACGIWTVVDWFLIMDAVKQKNMLKLIEMMNY